MNAQVSTLESELNLIEKVTEERKATVQSTVLPPAIPSTSYQANVSSKQTIVSSGSSSKSSRKSREHRTRSQEWPDVPDVGKIEENNPEILAQKILETGRQIEAGKLTVKDKKHSMHHTGE